MSLRRITLLLLSFAIACAMVVTVPVNRSFADQKTLTVGMERTPASLHPGATTALPDIAMNFLVYDGLVTTVDGQIKPLLAERWEVTPDGLEYTFYLRKDVTFHSGRKFTAKDVKAHFDNWKKLPTSTKIAALKSTEVIDDYTVKCTLNYPTLVFLTMISQTEWSYGGIPDSVAVEKYGQDYGKLPESVSGTGPYKLVNWIRDDRLVLAKNSDYKWAPEPFENRGPVKIETLVIRTIPEGASRAAELRTGGLDVDIDLQVQDAATFSKLKGFTVFTAPKVTANHLGFNVEREIFQDAKVRKAIAHAVNQPALIKVVWNDMSDMAYGLWSPSLDGHTPVEEMKRYYHSFDLEKAKQLLDEAGWEPGPDGIRQKAGKTLVANVYIYGEIMERMMQLIQADLRKVGVDFQIRRLEYAAWRRALEDGEHDMRYIDGTHSTADFAYWFVASSIPYPNHLRLRDETVEEWYDLTQHTIDPAVRTKAFQDIEQYLVGEAFVIPMPRARWLIGLNESVKGLTFDPIHGIHKLIDVYKEK